MVIPTGAARPQPVVMNTPAGAEESELSALQPPSLTMKLHQHRKAGLIVTRGVHGVVIR